MLLEIKAIVDQIEEAKLLGVDYQGHSTDFGVIWEGPKGRFQVGRYTGDLQGLIAYLTEQAEIRDKAAAQMKEALEKTYRGEPLWMVTTTDLLKVRINYGRPHEVPGDEPQFTTFIRPLGSQGDMDWVRQYTQAIIASEGDTMRAWVGGSRYEVEKYRRGDGWLVLFWSGSDLEYTLWVDSAGRMINV